MKIAQIISLAALVAAVLAGPVRADPPMTQDRLFEILRDIDPESRQEGAAIQLTLDEIPLVVIVDARADRMRAMVPIRSADTMDKDELHRLLQANFDSALDARYAIARGRLWGVFIHPLAALERRELLSGLIQTINVARSYGQTYSGGASVFGGGDSNEIYDRLLQELLDKGQTL